MLDVQREAEELLSPSAAARLLGLTARRVRQLARSGRLPATVTPLGRLYARADVDRLASERAARTEATP